MSDGANETGEKKSVAIWVAIIGALAVIIAAVIPLLKHEGSKVSPAASPAPIGGTPIATGPEAGLVHADQFSVSSDGGNGNEKKEDRFVALPVGAKVDTSYHQPAINAVTGGGRTSPITPSSIPAGFYIKCHGDDGGGRGWSVQPPYDGSPILTEKNNQLIFKLGMYADTGHPGISGGCTLVVDVFYKPAN